MISIVIAADHRGFCLKQYIQQHCMRVGSVSLAWLDVGAFDEKASDYPLYARKACEAILSGQASLGVLLCATGIGMSIVANRYRGIHAALVWQESIARLAKEHDCANVIVLPADFIRPQDAVLLIKTWIEADALGGRHERRVRMIDSIQ